MELTLHPPRGQTWTGQRLGYKQGFPCRKCHTPTRTRHARLPARIASSSLASSATISTSTPTGRQQDSNGRTAAHQQPEPASKTYNWFKAWYPVVIEADLDPRRPTAIKLLGRSLVLWRDADKVWRCFEDRCPHRLAPLSEGRIEPSDGTLMCTYHGWQFDGSGSCTKVPQASSAEADARARQSPRACAAAYPTQVLQRLVWVWGESGVQAEQESQLSAPATVPELLKPGDAVFTADWFMRDLPYGFDVLAENVLDPSHVPFAHHGVLGQRDRPSHARMVRQPDAPGKPGFAVHIMRDQPATKSEETAAKMRSGSALQPAHSSANGASSPAKSADSLQSGNAASMATGTAAPDPPADDEAANTQPVGPGSISELFWEPPCLARYVFGGRFHMVTYCIPTAPGRSRLLFCMFAPASKAPKLLRLAAFQASGPFRFLNHFSQNVVLDGDSILIHVQDHDLRRTSRSWDKRYYLPTDMDTAVIGLRRWLDGKAGGGPAWPEGAEWPAQDERQEVLLDRYHQHTQHCPSCSRALRVFSILQKVAMALAGLIAVAAAARLGAGRAQLASWSMAALAGAALACAAAARALHGLCRKFVFVDYVHSTR